MSNKKRTIPYGRTSAPAHKRRQVDPATDLVQFVDLSNDDVADMGLVPNTLSTDPLIPKRPTSQAAAMASEPSEDAIGQVQAFTGCQRSVAIRALKVKNNESQAAVNAVLDGEDLEKLEKDMGWNEESMNNVHPLGASAAPTRGNSPVGSMQPTSQVEADSQMAAALAASQQETGVVNADGSSTMIGPSNRHDTSNQWAMVRYGAQELLAEPEIAQRVQEKHAAEPRLVKHLTDGDYTPNLLTICHAIPAAREALLLKNWLKNDYGFDEGWWRGQPIPMPTVVHVADGSSAETLTDKQEEVIAEVQRLMAFLGHSDRIYASTGGLTETKLIKEHNLSSGSLLELFLKSWSAAVEPKDAAVSGIFTTKVGTTAKDGMDTPYLRVADISVQSEQGTKKDLSELLDDLLWNKDLEDDNYIEQPADVFVVTLKQADSKNKQVNVDVPASLSLDKYLQENIASSRILRQSMVQARSKIAKIESVEKRLTTWPYFDSQKADKEKAKLGGEREEKLENAKDQIGPKEMIVENVASENANAQVAVKDLLAHSLAHFSGENRKNADAADYPPDPAPPEYSDIAAKLERVMEGIEDKLRQLSINKEKTRSMLSDLSKSLPSSAGAEGPKYRYHLRGVATKPSITYVLTPKSDSDVEMTGQNVDMEIDLEDSTPAGMQWWRLAYESNGSSATIERTKAADYDVLRAVELEHETALLVYASDRAVAPPADSGSDLPEPLQQFVTRDNHQFKLDLDAAKRDPPSYHDFSTIRNSIERRDSNDSTAAMGPDSPPVDEIRLTPEEDGSGDVEMAEKTNSQSLTLSRDTAMSGVSESQDTGVGGGQHIEHADVDVVKRQ